MDESADVSILAAENLSVAFGGVRAIDRVNLAIEPAIVFSIIGPNGAGKTTLFNLFSGLYVPLEGSVRLTDEDVTGRSPDQLARRGLSRTFQNLQIFFRMTVLENVMVGRHRHETTNVLSDLLRLPSVWRQNRRTREAARAALVRVRLESVADRRADALPYGALKRLEIARALASEPKVLLLDEPAAGCNPVETKELDGVIARGNCQRKDLIIQRSVSSDVHHSTFLQDCNNSIIVRTRSCSISIVATRHINNHSLSRARQQHTIGIRQVSSLKAVIDIVPDRPPKFMMRPTAIDPA